MKKKTLLLLIALLLTSCSKSKNAVITPINGDALISENVYLDLPAEKCIDMMESSLSFLLFSYSSSCHACQICNELFSNYIKKNHYSVYRYTYGNDYSLLNEYDEYAFPTLSHTPRVMIIKDGKWVDDVASGKLTNKGLFNSAIDAFIRPNKNLYNVKTVNGYKNLVDNNEEFNVVIYDSSSKDGLDEYKEKCDVNNKELTIFVDKNQADSDLIKLLEDRT